MTISNGSIPDSPYGNLGIIALQSVANLAPKIDDYIVRRRVEKVENQMANGLYTDDRQSTYLIDAKIERFSDGEGKCVLNESIRGKDIYIIGDIGNYDVSYRMYGRDNYMGPDEHFQDIKRVVSAVGGKARRLTVFMPRLYASRQDKRNSRESLDCAMGLQELYRLGVRNILTFDAHSSQVQNAIPQCGFENLFATYKMIQALIEKNKDTNFGGENIVVISPDSGAMDRAIYYANVLGHEVGMFYKRRDYRRVTDGTNLIVAHEYMGPDLTGKDVIIVDDMIASGGTMFDLFKELKDLGVRNIYVCVTFAMFTKGIEKFTEYHEKGYFTKIISTNLSYIPEHIKVAPWFQMVDMATFIGKVIHLLNYDRSISQFFDDTAKINELLSENKL